MVWAIVLLYCFQRRGEVSYHAPVVIKSTTLGYENTFFEGRTERALAHETSVLCVTCNGFPVDAFTIVPQGISGSPPGACRCSQCECLPHLYRCPEGDLFHKTRSCLEWEALMYACEFNGLIRVLLNGKQERERRESGWCVCDVYVCGGAVESNECEAWKE